MVEVLLGKKKKKNYSSPRRAQCLQLVQQGVWDEKRDADRGDRSNAWLENWQRNSSRLPGGHPLRKEGLWAQKKEFWHNHEQQRWWSHCEMVVLGGWCQAQGNKGPKGARGLLGIYWKALFWTHIHAACRWTLEWPNPPLTSSPASSLEGSVHSAHACRPQTKWDLHKTDSVGISSSRTQFHQPQRLLLAVSWYLLTPGYVWLIDIIFDFYMEYLELLASTGFHSWFTWYKQMKEAMRCFPTSYSSCSWDCFYIQAYSCIFWFFREQRSPV